MINVALFKCETCFKTDITKNRLSHHPNAKHVVAEINNITEPRQCSTSTLIDEVKTVINTVSQDNLTELLKKIQVDLSAEECFTPEFCDRIKKYNFLDNNNQSLLVIRKIQEKKLKKCDADEYYSVFHSDIVISSTVILKGLDHKFLNWLKPVYLITHFSHKETNSAKVADTNPISEREHNEFCSIQTTEKN